MDPRRKKILFQNQHRGMKENDLLIGGYTEKYVELLTDEQLDRFEVLLQKDDSDLYNWIMGKEQVPAEFDNDIMAGLIAYKDKL